MKNLFLSSFIFLSQLSLTASQITYIDEVYEEAYESGAILGYYDGKVYLNSSSLIFDENDCLLDLNNDNYALLPDVYLDMMGYFISYFDDTRSSIQYCADMGVSTPCPDCGKSMFYRCTTSSCVEKRNRILNDHKESQKQKTKEYKEKKSKESNEKKTRKEEQKKQAKRTKEEKKKSHKV